MSISEELFKKLMKQDESETLDFKQKFTNTEDFLHDALCMFNSRIEQDKYLVYGISDDKKVLGLEEYLKSHNLNDTLNQAGLNKTFSVQVFDLTREGKKISIVVIPQNTIGTVTLTRNKGQLKKNNIYVRNGDTNTPKNETASIHIVEKLATLHKAIGGYSKDERKVAELFVKKSENGLDHDPTLTVRDIAEKTGLSLEDTQDAVNKLKEDGLLKPSKIPITAHPYDHSFGTDESLFIKFDQCFMEWNTTEDAVRIATDIWKDRESTNQPEKIAKQYGWKLRRLNPALRYLVNKEVIFDLRITCSHPTTVGRVQRKSDPAIRMFLKEHQVSI